MTRSVEARVNTVIGPVTVAASAQGLYRLDLPCPGQLRLRDLWARLGLPDIEPSPARTLADFGIQLSRCEAVPCQAAAPVSTVSAPGGAQLSPGDLVASICEVVERFFLGDLDGPALSFSWIPVDMGQRSPFSRAVMEGMRAIPGGFVASYSALATAAGAPRAARGAGSVVGANPVALVVPCHRVVGTGGRLTGYGGTLPLKVVMLALEAQMTRRPGEPIPL